MKWLLVIGRLIVPRFVITTIVGIYVFLAFCSTTLAQTTLQVVTKVVEKELTYLPGKVIMIRGQKADINVRTWNRAVVGVRLRLVAKNPSRAIAEHDVSYHQYTLQDNGTELDISNRFSIPMRDGPLTSQLKAIFEVSLPANAVLTITNSFGDVTLRDLTGEVSLKAEFGKLTLTNLSGKTLVQTNYGDLLGNDISGAFTARITNADAVFQNLGGTVKLRCVETGKLTIRPNSTALAALTVEADQVPISLIIKQINSFSYDLRTVFYAAIRVPPGYRSYLTNIRNRSQFGYQPPGNQPLIRISADTGPVTILPGTTDDEPIEK
jgi:hypothetical protein